MALLETTTRYISDHLCVGTRPRYIVEEENDLIWPK